MNQWEKLADEQTFKRAVASLKNNNVEAIVVKNGEEARKKVLKFLPKGAEVMTMSSLTLGLEMQKMGSAPEWAIGLVASATGSQHGQVLVEPSNEELQKALDANKNLIITHKGEVK